MSPAFVDHLSYALPNAVRTVEEAVADARTISDAAALRESGFVQHHICADGESAYDLAYRAVKPLQPHLDQVDALIYATCIPANGNIGKQADFSATRDVKYLMDYPASHLQSDFGLDSAAVFGLNQQACTSMLGSIRLAATLIRGDEDIRKVLCVTADRFPDEALYEQSYNLISDGAAACIVSDAPGGFRFLAAHATTNGAMALASDDETVGSFFSYSHRTITDTLEKARLSISDIDWIVPQNTNAKAWMVMSRLLGFDFSRVFFPSISAAGHVISGDNIINLHELVSQGKIAQGERVLLFMAGYGLNWQCIVLEKC